MKPVSPPQDFHHGLLGRQDCECFLNRSQKKRRRRRDGPLMLQGQRVRGHEFHWSTLEEPPDPDQSVYKVVDQDNRADGFQAGSVWASYIHIHLGSDPSLAPRFVETCAPHSSMGL